MRLPSRQTLLKKSKGGVQSSLDVLRALQAHSTFTHAAACAFFLFLSLPPGMLALVSLIGMIPIEAWTEATTTETLELFYSGLTYIVPTEMVRFVGIGFEVHLHAALIELQSLSSVRVSDQLTEFLSANLPEDLAAALNRISGNILGNPRSGFLTISFLTILWSASGATRATMRALSTVYEVKHRSIIGRNFLSLVLTVGFIVTWTVTLALLPVSNTFANVVVDYFGWDQGVKIAWSVFNWSIGAGVLLGSVFFMNRFGPDVQLRLRALLPGSLLSVLLWVILSAALGKWMEQSWLEYNATYGTLAAIIAVLLWCYLMSIGLLLGAEFNTAVLRVRTYGIEGSGMELEEATRAAVESEIVTEVGVPKE
ncbi:MAG: YihY family inner membrane protein [Planctomycetota bacterium]|jgi:YihY family inner membrane protein